jgi:hypothetical protein
LSIEGIEISPSCKKCVSELWFKRQCPLYAIDAASGMVRVSLISQQSESNAKMSTSCLFMLSTVA